MKIMTKSMTSILPTGALAAMSLVLLGACSDNTGPSSANQVGVGFQLARTSTAPAIMAAGIEGSTISVGAPPTITTTAEGMRIERDGDVLLVSKAQLVVRNVKLKSVSDVCTDDDDDETTATASTTDDDDECAVVRVGPYLVDVPVSGADGARVSVEVPEGTYSSLRLWLHKVTSNGAADVAFRAANPDFRDISLRLEGTFNGTPFTFTNDVNAKLTVPLAEPLVVGTGGEDVTVSIDLSTWFLRSSGGLYSPASASTPGQIRAQVQNNIRGAFRAFTDKNRDGRED